MRQQVEETIEAIRPALQADGGDIFLREVDEDAGIITVTLVGACGTCPASTDTLKAGIERIMKDRVDGVTEVVAVCVAGRAREPGPLLEAARAGDRAALARLLSMVERGGEPARELGRLAYPLTGHTYTVGLTGAPGAGKSTLTSALLSHLRSQDEQVAVLAIDPTSPFSGGAILGDRVRMQDHATDPGVFIRSMATRGHLGGLALAVPEAVRLLDAVGTPLVIVETVGVGQVEVEVAGQADTTVVVVNPGWGDGVQANKAGLMEIADVFVINKADRQGVAETRRDLELMLDLSELGDWRPPIVTAVATDGTGVAEVWEAVLGHRASMDKTGALEQRRSARTRRELHQIVTSRLEKRALELCRGVTYDELEQAVLDRDLDPWAAADVLLREVDA